MDAAWGQFAKYLSYKAENAGRKLIRVNPAYTSQTCSKCGHRESIKLSDRIYTCSCCKVSIDRDYNASLNILSLGLQTLGFTPESP
jgi:putative transposase